MSSNLREQYSIDQEAANKYGISKPFCIVSIRCEPMVFSFSWPLFVVRRLTHIENRRENWYSEWILIVMQPLRVKSRHLCRIANEAHQHHANDDNNNKIKQTETQQSWTIYTYTMGNGHSYGKPHQFIWIWCWSAMLATIPLRYCIILVCSRFFVRCFYRRCALWTN